MSILSRSSLFSSLYSGWAFIPVSYTHLLQDASNERKKYIAKISEWSAHKIEAAEEEKRLMARYFNFISAFIEKEAKSEIIAKAFNLIEINKEMELLKKDELFPYIKKLYSETIQEFRDYDNINFVGGNEMARKYFCLLYTSQGLDVWGMKTRKCEVLYLCLEDSFNRLQDRLYSICLLYTSITFSIVFYNVCILSRYYIYLLGSSSPISFNYRKYSPQYGRSYRYRY